MTITDFLLARITEDEAEARDAGADAMMGARWKHYPEQAYNEIQSLTLATSRRVLAECEAKRRIVAEHQIETSADDPVCRHIAEVPCPTLRALAAIYADHPDYGEAWRRGDGA